MRGLARLIVWTSLASPLSAQWSAGIEVGMLRFWGTSVDTLAVGDPARTRPSPSTGYALRLQRGFGTVGVGMRVLYAPGGAGVENGAAAVEEKGLVTFWELAPEGSCVLARPADGALQLSAGPVFDRWSLKGGNTTSRLGARAALALDWTLGGPWIGRIQGEAGVSESVFDSEDLPLQYGRRATWRRMVSAGVAVRF